MGNQHDGTAQPQVVPGSSGAQIAQGGRGPIAIHGHSFDSEVQLNQQDLITHSKPAVYDTYIG
jgi:hypothetical protein